jgi:hypothetical protein
MYNLKHKLCPKDEITIEIKTLDQIVGDQLKYT